MAQAINLLPQVAETEIQKGVYKRKINLVAIASLLIVGAVAVGLFTYQLFLSVQAHSLDNKATDLEKQLSEKRDDGTSLIDVEIQQKALINKLGAIKTYWDKNKSVADSFKQIMELAATGSIALTRVQDNSAGSIVIAGSSFNSNDLGDLFDHLTSEGAQVSLDKVIATNVTLASQTYQFTIRMNYTKNGILATDQSQ